MEIGFDVRTRKLALVLAKTAHRRRYFSELIAALIPVATDDDEVSSMASDEFLRLYYRPEVLEDLPIDEGVGLVCHEIEHILRGHGPWCRHHGYEPGRANVAADIAINGGLSRQRDISLPANGYFPSTLGFPENETEDQYYLRLEPHAEKLKRKGGRRCGSSADGQRRRYDLGSPTGAYRGKLEKEVDLLRKRVAQDIREAHSADPGNVPGNLVRWAEAYLNPKIPWQDEFGGEFKWGLSQRPGQSDDTYATPSWWAEASPDVVLPGGVESDPTVLVIMDTSSSMVKTQLERCVGEVGGILRSEVAGDRVYVLCCDTAAEEAKLIRSEREIELVGGGGTDMGIGLLAAAKHQPFPDITVVMTDGGTPWPAQLTAEMRVIVLLVPTDENHPVDPNLIAAVPSWAKVIVVS